MLRFVFFVRTTFNIIFNTVIIVERSRCRIASCLVIYFEYVHTTLLLQHLVTLDTFRV